jgi:hypothetical protein
MQNILLLPALLFRWISVMKSGLLNNSRFCLQGQLCEKVCTKSLHSFLILCNMCIQQVDYFSADALYAI